jgi:hypothetical protein
MDPRVLVDLTEQVLRVDQMQAPSEEPGELEAEAIEVLVLRLDHVLDHVRFDSRRVLAKALADSVLRPRARYDEVVLAERQQLGVVEVDGVLKREERAEARKDRKGVVHGPERRRREQISHEATAHHLLEQTQVVRVLAVLTEPRRRHHVSR